jgi:hypothetical protein
MDKKTDLKITKAALHDALTQMFTKVNSEVMPAFKAIVDEPLDTDIVRDFQERFDAEKAKLAASYPTYDELLDFATRREVCLSRSEELVLAGMAESLYKLEAQMGPINEEIGKFNPKVLNQFIPADEIVSFMNEKLLDITSEMNSTALAIGKTVSAAQHLAAKKDSKRLLSISGKDGGTARGDKFKPVRMLACDRAKLGRFNSALHAARILAPSIVETPEFKNAGLSSDRAVQTLAEWFRKEKISFKSDTET